MATLHTRGAALLALAAGFTCAPAGAGEDDGSLFYRLTPDADFTEGCFDPCACPIWFNDSLRGKFRLTPDSIDPLFDNYTVTGVRLALFFSPNTVRRFEGAGTYRIGGEFALMNQMTLELSDDGAPPETFDSNLIVGGVGFPDRIDLTISKNDLFCFDTALHISAHLVRGSISDLNEDSFVNAADLAIVLGGWGTDDVMGDLDFDGVVGASDVAVLLGEWGPE